MAWLNFPSSFCLTASCWVRLSSVVFSLKKKFIMRSQSGNYNYSKTFFFPLGHIWAMFVTTLKVIFPPLWVHLLQEGMRRWFIHLCTLSTLYWGNRSQRSVGILKELWFAESPYTVLAFGSAKPQGCMLGSLETTFPNHKMCIEISWKQPVFTAFGMPTLFLARQ